MIGKSIGPYQILAELGEGGMGRVYRAHDTKLGRDVAFKVLPDTFAGDADRLARFEREARTLAALNHPNISHVYDAGRTDGIVFLAMELVSGEDLSRRLATGPLPLPEALSIAKQIADALEAAHEQGIIHRDLKPANIKVRDDGVTKVLDFGLAKVLAPDAGASGVVDSAAAANSPTLTAAAFAQAHGEPGTQMGVILGTAAYMAPEQARGRAVDRRADIWAFGCVLLEMLTGRRAFEGEDVSTTLAEVIKGDAPTSRLPADVPPRIRMLIQRCLVKDPRRRLQSIGDARIEIEDAINGPAEQALAPPRASKLPWVIAAIAVAGLAGVAIWAASWRKPDSPAVVRAAIDIGVDASLATGAGPAAVISPDGKAVALIAQGESGAPQLFYRRLDELNAVKLDDATDAISPFFSPNGEWIGYFARNFLRKIRVSGGPSFEIAPVTAARGGTWLADDTIVFNPLASPGGRLMRVPASGAEPPRLFGNLATGEVTQRWPQALPDGKSVLYTGHVNVDAFDDATLMVMPIGGGDPKVIHRGGYHGRYLSSGHLLYVRAGILFAVPFELSSLQTRGEPIAVVTGIASSNSSAVGQFSVSDNGTLVYLPGGSVGGGATLSWLPRGGKPTALTSQRLDWISLAFSPDGRQLAIEVVEGPQRDIVIHEISTDTTRRLTSSPTYDVTPIWSEDGRRIAYVSAASATGNGSIVWQRADGGGQPVRLFEAETAIIADGWHSGGNAIAYTETRPGFQGNLLILPLQTEAAGALKAGTPKRLRETPGTGLARFSPDGRWIAYVVSGKPGAFDVYVEPFSGSGGRWQVSSGSAVWAVWSRKKQELLYADVTGGVWVVPYTVEADTFRPGKPQLWAPERVALRSGLHPFDLHPDGERIVTTLAEETPAVKQTTMRVIFNLPEVLRSRKP